MIYLKRVCCVAVNGVFKKEPRICICDIVLLIAYVYIVFYAMVMVLKRMGLKEKGAKLIVQNFIGISVDKMWYKYVVVSVVIPIYNVMENGERSFGS